MPPLQFPPRSLYEEFLKPRLAGAQRYDRMAARTTYQASVRYAP